MVKEATMRGFVNPGDLLTIEAKVEHEGSGLCGDLGQGARRKELKCSADLTFRQIPFPHLTCACTWTRWPPRSAFPLQAMTHD